MKSILKSVIFDNNIQVLTFNEDFAISAYKEQTKIISNEYGEGTIRVIQLDGIRVTSLDIKTREHTIDVTHDFPFFKLQFEIQGSSHYKPLNKLSKPVYIPNGHYNLFYLPEVDGVLNYKTNYRKTLEIVFTEKYIKKIIGENFKQDLKNFGNAIKNREPFLMWKQSKPISIELQQYVDAILNCKYDGNLKKAYLETKINELLIILLAKTNTNAQEVNIPKKDYPNILNVEKHIKNNLKTPLTIADLGIIAGMNTTKLKQEFKIVFGTTIFKYITKLRMEKAKDLILNEGYTIAEATYKVGYKQPQHFTVAFKKLYGYLPSKLIH